MTHTMKDRPPIKSGDILRRIAFVQGDGAVISSAIVWAKEDAETPRLAPLGESGTTK